MYDECGWAVLGLLPRQKEWCALINRYAPNSTTGGAFRYCHVLQMNI